MSSDTAIQAIWLERKLRQARAAGQRGDLDNAIRLGLEVLKLRKAIRAKQSVTHFGESEPT